MELKLFSGMAAMIFHIVPTSKNEKLKAQSDGQLLCIVAIVFTTVLEESSIILWKSHQSLNRHYTNLCL